MTRRSLCSLVLAAGLLGALIATGAPAQTPKRGGILNAMLIENPPGTRSTTTRACKRCGSTADRSSLSTLYRRN
jgi:hypothetical protein